MNGFGGQCWLLKKDKVYWYCDYEESTIKSLKSNLELFKLDAWEVTHPRFPYISIYQPTTEIQH